MLNYTQYGQGAPLILIHGLLGSGINMGLVARSLKHRFRVIVPDMRNHGRSFHSPAMSYDDMAGDLLVLMDSLGLDRAFIAGHSMGGKCAMQFAMNHPDRVAKLVVVDIAPRQYTPGWGGWLKAMLNLDLAGLKRRRDADRLLAGAVPERDFRLFLLQNLASTGQGFYWRSNLETILETLPMIGSAVSGPVFPGTTLFIRGSESDYIRDEDWEEIQLLFPNARLQTVMGASHLVHFEFRGLFTELLMDFFFPRSGG